MLPRTGRVLVVRSPSAPRRDTPPPPGVSVVYDLDAAIWYARVRRPSLILVERYDLDEVSLGELARAAPEAELVVR